MMLFFIFNWFVFFILTIQSTNAKYCEVRIRNVNLPAVKVMLQNCTFIDGYLDIYLNGGNYAENDEAYEYLDGIEYVTGYVSIRGGAFESKLSPPTPTTRVFSMKNLKAIYGEILYDGIYSLIIDNSFNSLSGFDFRTLKVIAKGSVGFFESKAFCNATKIIKWDDIFLNPNQQNVKQLMSWKSCSKEETNLVNCNEKCEKFDNKNRYCYGQEVNQCQTKSYKQCKQSCKYCFLNESNQLKECCHPQCLGGCKNQLASGCYACKGLSYKGECLHKCGMNTYQYAKICVDSCPKTKLIYKKSCVHLCPRHFINEDGVCKKCRSKRDCGGSVCYLLDKDGNHIAYLNRTSLLSLKNCTRLIGSIIINGRSFRPNFDPINSIDDFMAMRDLKRIEGILYLDLGRLSVQLKNHSKFQSVFFLENLEEVDGIKSPNIPNSAAFVNTPFVYFGLKSLRRFNGQRILFYKNPNLQYIHSVKWNKLGIDSVKDVGSLPSKPCDPKCDAEWGCMGPGSQQCLRKS